MAASYLAKYVSKSLDDERRAARLHRYEVAQGFQPERVQLAGRLEAQVLADASDRMGGEPSRVWRSSSAEGGRSRQRCGVRGLTEQQIAEIRDRAVASAAAQGLSAKVQDAAILRRVAALVRPGLAAPDERDPGRIKRVAAGVAGPMTAWSSAVNGTSGVASHTIRIRGRATNTDRSSVSKPSTSAQAFIVDAPAIAARSGRSCPVGSRWHRHSPSDGFARSLRRRIDPAGERPRTARTALRARVRRRRACRRHEREALQQLGHVDLRHRRLGDRMLARVLQRHRTWRERRAIESSTPSSARRSATRGSVPG